jgi:hypothetical protein
VAARLTFDPVGCAVWLDPPVLGEEPVQLVCSIHAATLTVPLGWTVTDRRFEAPAEPEPDRSMPPELPTRPGPVEVDVVEAAPVVAEPVAPEQVESEPVESDPVEVAPAAAEPAEPQPAVVVRRRRSERRRAGLLDRALRSSGPQHSVLTQQPEPPGGSGDTTEAPGDTPDAGS